MFDILIKEQPQIYDYFNSQLKSNKISHAYLFDVGQYNNYEQIILDVVKMIVCSKIKNNDEKEKICLRIDSGNCPEVIIVRPDGMWIKKEQLTELQNQFSMIGIESQYRVYVIFDCDKMNKQSSNSILKFLEEPSENIISLLVTQNSNRLLKTIMSRCQFIKLKTDKEINIINYDDEFTKNVIDFVKFVENNKYDTIIYIKELWFKFFTTKEEVELAISIMISYYYNELKEIVKSDDNCLFNKILNRIEILIDVKNNIKYNLNMNMMIDKMIIDLVGDNNEICFNKE